MSDLRKAAEMALEFCEDIGDLGGPYPYVNETAVVSDSRKVLQALRQALAESEQEPVAWMHNFIEGTVITHEPADIDRHPDRWTPLYTAPPKREWVGLTDEEINDWFFQRLKQAGAGWVLDDVVRAVEAKLKEKNT